MLEWEKARVAVGGSDMVLGGQSCRKETDHGEMPRADVGARQASHLHLRSYLHPAGPLAALLALAIPCEKPLPRCLSGQETGASVLVVVLVYIFGLGGGSHLVVA